MPKHELTIDFENEPERPEPEGGWVNPCTVADHQWELELEDGRPVLQAVDPCSDEKIAKMDPGVWGPICRSPYWASEDLVTDYQKPIPVKVEHIDDSTPSTPNGPAEYGYYLLISPLPDSK